MRMIGNAWTLLLGLIAHHFLYQELMAHFIEEDTSDEHMDQILHEFLRLWKSNDHDIGRFESIMTDIGRQFHEVNSVELLERYRDRLGIIIKSLHREHREDQLREDQQRADKQAL